MSFYERAMDDLTKSFQEDFIRQARELNDNKRGRVSQSTKTLAFKLSCESLAKLALDPRIIREVPTSGNALSAPESDDRSDPSDPIGEGANAREGGPGWGSDGVSLITCPDCKKQTELWPNRDYRMYCDCGYREKVVHN